MVPAMTWTESPAVRWTAAVHDVGSKLGPFTSHVRHKMSALLLWITMSPLFWRPLTWTPRRYVPFIVGVKTPERKYVFHHENKTSWETIMIQNHVTTRMHSSRIRTARSSSRPGCVSTRHTPGSRHPPAAGTPTPPPSRHPPGPDSPQPDPPSRDWTRDTNGNCNGN